MNTSDLIKIGAVGLGVYFLYTFLSKKIPDAAKKATAPLSQAIANFWVSLTASPPMPVLGDVILPDGTDIGPLSQFSVGKDSSGNVYIQSGADVYQVQPSNAQGNWPATLVTAPDFGVTGTTW